LPTISINRAQLWGVSHRVPVFFPGAVGYISAAYPMLPKGKPMLDPNLIAAHIARVGGMSTDGNVLKQFIALARQPSSQAAAMKYPIPNPGDSVSAFNGLNIDYQAGGIWNANTVARMIARHGKPGPLDVLDFGCGSGRLLRFFLMFLPEHRYKACEVNAAAVDWLKTWPADAKVMRPEPPAPYPDQSFDAIYAWSIFTHYAEALHLGWLRDLKRMLRPGGLLLATVHNDALVGRYGSEPKLVARMKERGANYDEVVERYRHPGFSYWRSYPEEARANGIDPETFGMAFISRDYIDREWTKVMPVAEIVKDVVPNWQDLVVLRRN
jgi:SAM-dependent methyltransferase